MNNFYSKLMLGFLLLSTSTINAQTTTYCAPTWSGWAVNEPTEPITSVQFGTGTGSINNTTSATVSASTPRYEDFSTTSMNVQRGQTYDLKVKGNTDGNNTNYITVYFDWNGDGVFSNATPANAAAQQVLTNQPEKHQHTTAIINSTGADNIEMVHSVTIPTDAVLGSIRMRIVKNYNAPSPAPCANPFIFGQVEDYTLNITNGSCPAVSSFSENFDASTLTCCNMGVVPQCWNSISTATGANQIISNTTPASGTNNIYQFGYGTNLQSIVVMPEVNNINSGTHQFRFKLRANSGPGNLDFGYITDITNASTFVIIQTINVTNSSYNDPIAERVLKVPTTVPSTARLAIRNPGTSWAGFYWDDANWEPIPQAPCTDPGPNPGDTGCVTFTYNGTSVTYTTVRGADNQIWLQQNLGSTQVATSVSDAASYGDYFQWGRWVDGHQVVNSTLTATPPTPNNPSGISNGSTAFYSAAYNSPNNWWSTGTTTDTWSTALPSSATSTDGCDPCKAIGNGWRLPTITEIGTMITSENLSNVSATGAFASNLKIPASGTKDYSGMFSQGSRSYFWSSTPIYTGSAQYFYSGLAVTVEGHGGRDTGIPIRCIYQATIPVNTVAVTTQNNVAATITAANGTLQLQAAITPTSANQTVTWSVQSGSTSATVDNTGLVTGLTNGTAVIRATSVADTTKFGELTVTINIPTANPCTAVQTFLETFETFTAFPENCWTANYPNYPTVDLNGTTNKAIQLYSGNQPNDIILVSPEVSTIDGQHQLVFDIVSTNGAGTTVQIGTMTDNTDFSTFAVVGAPFTPSVGSHSTQAIPANAGHKYVAIRFIHGGGHGKVLVVDNVEWKQVTASNDKFDADKVKIYPNPTTGMFFIDTDIDVKSIEIYNTSGQRILKTNQKNINLENASNGLYIVNVYATDGTHASYKIIKK